MTLCRDVEGMAWGRGVCEGGGEWGGVEGWRGGDRGGVWRGGAWVGRA